MNPDFEPGKRIEQWFCTDCHYMEQTGETLADTEPERESEVDSCLRGLHGQYYVFPDTSDEPQMECRDCFHIGRRVDFTEVVVDEYETNYLCPECNSDYTERRGNGEDEFSWSECDCCGTRLGGSRYRYALFPRSVHEDATT